MMGNLGKITKVSCDLTTAEEMVETTAKEKVDALEHLPSVELNLAASVAVCASGRIGIGDLQQAAYLGNTGSSSSSRHINLWLASSCVQDDQIN